MRRSPGTSRRSVVTVTWWQGLRVHHLEELQRDTNLTAWAESLLAMGESLRRLLSELWGVQSGANDTAARILQIDQLNREAAFGRFMARVVTNGGAVHA